MVCSLTISGAMSLPPNLLAATEPLLPLKPTQFRFLKRSLYPTHRIPNSAKLFYLMCCLSDIFCEGQSRIGARREGENETNQFASTISRDDTNRLHRRGLQQPRRLVSLARRIRPPCGGAFNSVSITSRKVNRTRSLLFSDQARETSTSRSAVVTTWSFCREDVTAAPSFDWFSIATAESFIRLAQMFQSFLDCAHQQLDPASIKARKGCHRTS